MYAIWQSVYQISILSLLQTTRLLAFAVKNIVVWKLAPEELREMVTPEYSAAIIFLKKANFTERNLVP